MKFWLVSVCVIGSLYGGVLAMYSPVSTGSDGLVTMALSLQNVSKVVRSYHSNLNDARNKVWPTITRLQLYANTTYLALNSSYGATQPNLQSLLSSMQWFTQQFTYGDQMVSSTMSSDLSQLNSQMQQTIDQIMQSYNMLISSFAYQQNADTCSEQYACVFSKIPGQLSKFGRCLQPAVDTVPTVVEPLNGILTVVLNDLMSLNKQLQICAPTSSNCIKEYFAEIYSELSYVNMELSLAAYLLMNYQQDAMQRNQLCGQLVSNNVQDIIQDLSMQYSQCMYPSSMMG